VTVTGPPFAIWRRKIGIPEANRDEARGDVLARAVGLDDPLAERLRLAHHGLRVDGLVGRDEQEALCAELDRDLGEDPRPERVVADGLERVGLHQRHVLVGGRVEDDARPVAVEDLPHLRPALHIREHRDARREAALVHELALDLEQGRLALVDEDQPLGPEAGDLAAELGADRAAGAGDEHRLVLEIRSARVEIDVDRLAAEDVLDLHRPDLRREVGLAGDQLVQPRQRLDRHVVLPRDRDDPLACLAGGGRDRDQDLVGPVVAQDVRQLLGRAEDADAVDAQVLLARVVVDQPDRRVAELAVALHLADRELARVAGADHQHLLAAGDETAGTGARDHAAGEQARAGDQPEEEQPVHHRHRARQPHLSHGRNEVDGQAGDERGSGYAAHGRPHVADGHVAPPAVVETEEDEDDELDRNHDQDRPAEQRVVVARHALVEAQREGQVPREGNQPRIGDELPNPVSIHRYHARTAAASRITATTFSCTSAGIPAHIGSARFSAAAFSVSGNEPSFWPR